MKKTTKTPCGIQWTMSTRLEDLDFADDICLISQRESDMKDKLKNLIHYAGQIGLKINVGKTKLMRFDPQSNQRVPQLQIDGILIEEVNEFQYLGSIISKDGGAESDIKTRINKARQAYCYLNNLWNTTQISRHLKLSFFRSNVLSVLLYGCETWKVTIELTNKLQVFVNRCLRRILKIRWPETISNVELWRRCRFEEIGRMIAKRKWSWIGHTLRRKENEIARQALEWNPQGRRKVGRPRMTWRRSVIMEAKARGKSWREVKALAGNKVRWRSFVDALCAL
jgi:hypothetical protein